MKQQIRFRKRPPLLISADDKIYCVYIAPDEERVRQHAQKGGFPGE